MSSVKVAVIGCGYWGANHIRNFSQLGALVAVCDADQKRAAEVAANYDVRALSFAEVLADKSIHGVVIAAPAAQHYSLAERSLKAGKHVFVEKPLALKAENARKLCILAAECERTLMVGHLLQYHPGFIALKDIVARGDLGRLQYIYSNRLNLGKFRNEENILWSFAPHDISMILSLVGDMPETVYATGSCHLSTDIQDVTMTHMSFKNNIQAHVYVSWLHPYKEQKLIVIGSQGMAVFDDSLPWEKKLQVYPHEIAWVNGMPTPKKAESVSVELPESEPLKLECQHFLDCMQTGGQAKTDGEEGLAVLRVLSAAQTSLHTGKEASFSGPEEEAFFKHETAIVDPAAKIGNGTKIWHFSHVLKGVTIGEQCVLGQNVMVGPSVKVGNGCKIQNNVSIYEGVTLDDGVFCGPSCVFTNVRTPRAEVNRRGEFAETHVGKGVSIGANSTIVCGVNLGAYSFIGAGAVVTKDVKPHALVVGNPAKQIGWVSLAGEVLGDDLKCPRDNLQYRVNDLEQLEVVVSEQVGYTNLAK